MAIKDPISLLNRLCASPEAGWLEFKVNNADPEMIGNTLAALANSAMLDDRERAFMVFGVEDGSRRQVGTSVRLLNMKIGGEDFMNWLSRLLQPRLLVEHVDFHVDGLDFAILAIEPTFERPVAFKGVEFIRIGANVRRLRDFPNHERSLWQATSRRKFEQSIAHSNVTGIKWLKHDFMSNMSLRERFSLNDQEYQAASAVITDTVRSGRIKPAEKDQGKKNARYVPYWA